MIECLGAIRTSVHSSIHPAFSRFSFRLNHNPYPTVATFVSQPSPSGIFPSSRNLSSWYSHQRQSARYSRVSSFPASSSSTIAMVSVSTSADAVPPLETLQQLVRERLGDAADRVRLPHTTERLFREEEEQRGGQPVAPIKLYRDNSAWCPYCERVWLQLEEKKVPYTVEKINMRCYGPKPDWFMKMVPSGLLPVIELNGRVLTESLDVMLAIEAAFPAHRPLLPPLADAAASSRVQRLLRLERRVFGAWLQWGTQGEGGMWGGGGGQAGFEGAMDEVDAALQAQGGPYFLGTEFSLVDAIFAPFLERIAASVPFWKGLQVRGNPRWPQVNAWFDAMDSRPAYQAIKSDDFTITHTLEPQIGPVLLRKEGAAHRDFIEGRGGAWDLPLGRETTAWGTDDGTGAGGAKEEAAGALLSNHAAIVRFALRSASPASHTQWGLKGSTSEQAEEQLGLLVGLAFRHVAHALLEGVEAAGAPPEELRAPEVALAVAYLRDRVGVPRDLTYPAARQLRAHLQWFLRSSGSDL